MQSLRSQTQHSSHGASRFTIATRVGSASALKRAASDSLSLSSSGGVSGPQQSIGIVAMAFIENLNIVHRHPSMKGGAMSDCAPGSDCCGGEDCC